MIRQQEASRAAQVAQLRDTYAMNQPAAEAGKPVSQQAQAEQQGVRPSPVPVLSEAELARQEKAFDAAYAIFQRDPQGIRPDADRRTGPGRDPAHGLALAGPDAVAAFGRAGREVRHRQPHRRATPPPSPGNRPRPAGVGHQAAGEAAGQAGDGGRGLGPLRRRPGRAGPDRRRFPQGTGPRSRTPSGTPPTASSPRPGRSPC